MTATIYTFGNFADGYSQYPNDYTRELFEKCAKTRTSTTELIYHRNGALAYYIYIREISHSENTFIGLCYVFNDILITKLSQLFDIFEDTITNIVVNGELLEFTEEGNISTKTKQLYLHTKELQRISNYLNSKLSSLGKYISELPPINYSISRSEWKTFTFDEIATAQIMVKDYSNVRITKGENYSTDSFNSYANKLKTQHNTIITQNQEITNLKEQLLRLNRQKKRTTIVTMLSIIVAIGAIIFFIVVQNKNNDIGRLNGDVLKLTQENETLSLHVQSLQHDSTTLTTELQTVNNDLRISNDRIQSLRSDSSNLQSQNEELYSISENQKKRINQQNNKISELEQTIRNLRNNNSYSAPYSVGPSTNHSLSGHDAGYAQWIYTTKSLRINHFYVHPDKSGYITIGLYNSNGSLISSYQVYVTSNQWNKVAPLFELSSYTKYYLAIKESNGISLGYHKAGNAEYNNYKNGNLQLLGACSKSEKNYTTTYYQYFYSINYSIKN